MYACMYVFTANALCACATAIVMRGINGTINGLGVAVVRHVTAVEAAVGCWLHPIKRRALAYDSTAMQFTSM